MGLPRDRVVLGQAGKDFKGKVGIGGLASKALESSAKHPMSNSAQHPTQKLRETFDTLMS